MNRHRGMEYFKWAAAVRSIGACMLCGSKENLCAHHVLSGKKAPHRWLDPSNGVCVCEDCHRKKLHSKPPQVRLLFGGNPEVLIQLQRVP